MHAERKRVPYYHHAAWLDRQPTPDEAVVLERFCRAIRALNERNNLPHRNEVAAAVVGVIKALPAVDAVPFFDRFFARANEGTVEGAARLAKMAITALLGADLGLFELIDLVEQVTGTPLLDRDEFRAIQTTPVTSCSDKDHLI